ncbi:reverse transcriptase, partial [Lasius niger]
MPRAKPRPQRAAYWWTEEIADLRRTSVQARRRFKRMRRRGLGDNDEGMAEALEHYRTSRNALSAAIKKSKARSWDEQLQDLNADPWGRPYKAVMKKLRRWTPPVTEALDTDVLDNILSTLFPQCDRVPELYIREPVAWEEEYEVSSVELAGIVKRLRAWGNKAPGPDGIPGKVWLYALTHLSEPVYQAAVYGLLKSRGVPPSLGRMREVGPNLHEKQFGFREKRSTTDAILRVRHLVESETGEGRVVIAIALDITNAFNTLPWGKVRGALIDHGAPPYLVEVVKAYLRDRSLEYRNKTGAQRGRAVSYGVPQGVVCYADDTIVLAGGNDWGDAKRMADLAVACVVRSNKGLGLKVAPHKTEAIYFHNGSRGKPPGAHVIVDGIPVQLGQSIKYLGLWLDGTWRFGDHFDRLAVKANGVAAALSRLLPNIGGPDDRVRKLYANVVNSVTLYGSPVWADEAMATRRIKDVLRQIQRRVAIRVVRGYRTVSHAAASALAGLPPMELQACTLKRVYERIKELRGMNFSVTERVRGVVRTQARRRMIEEWGDYLENVPPTNSGRRVVGAVRPVLDEWVDRSHGRMSF